MVAKRTPGLPDGSPAPEAVSGAPPVRIAGREDSMHASLGRVAPTMTVPAGNEAAPQTLADRAMNRYADGDAAAFGTLYDELAPRLYRYALHQTRSRSAAEDVVQQAFLQIHCARDRFVRGAAVLGWAYAITRRLLIDRTRRRDHEDVSADGASGNAAAISPAVRADEAMVLLEHERLSRRDLEELAPALREAFQLVKLEGLSVAEAAEVLGITPGMVKIRTHRARVALERKAVARGAGPPRAGNRGGHPD